VHSLTEENYLKALYNLANELGEVNVHDLSNALSIKMPTVTSMMKKLAAKDLVHYESYRPLRLTDSGRREAALIIRKHRLTEMYLVQKMGFGWEEVHEIAEQIEHIHAPEFFARMDEMLGFPMTDPHGSPIPDAKGNILLPEYEKLSGCQPHQPLKLAAVLNTGDDFLTYLNKHDLRLGRTFTLVDREPFDLSIQIQFEDGRILTLSAAVSDKLLVVPG
jgi:DtxR family Mn-dependent transcriptional regulator